MLVYIFAKKLLHFRPWRNIDFECCFNIVDVVLICCSVTLFCYIFSALFLYIVYQCMLLFGYFRTKKSTSMVWTDIHDELLCREIIGVDVFAGTKKGTAKRSAKWSVVVDNLSNVEAVYFRVDDRAVRDRYNLLSLSYRRKLKKEVRASGIEVEVTEVEKALEGLIEKEDAAEELRQEGRLKDGNKWGRSTEGR